MFVDCWKSREVNMLTIEADSYFYIFLIRRLVNKNLKKSTVEFDNMVKEACVVVDFMIVPVSQKTG